ncbi:hypothetical protein LA6_001681 [Marinibacterium anthonyi]|nr:hypothetical protein LA6_001681 [Marinibacterium anthonyi]
MGAIGRFFVDRATVVQTCKVQNAMRTLRCGLAKNAPGEIGAKLAGAERELEVLKAMPEGRAKAAEMAVHLERLRAQCASRTAAS